MMRIGQAIIARIPRATGQSCPCEAAPWSRLGLCSPDMAVPLEI